MIKTHTIGLSKLRNSILNFLDTNRDVVAIPSMVGSTGRKMSITEYRKEMSSSQNHDRDQYRNTILELITDLMNSLVAVSVRQKFNCVPANTVRYYHDLVTSMMMPSVNSVMYISQSDDDGVSQLDEATILFDDLYIEALELLECYEFDRNSIVDFKIADDCLLLDVGGDYRIAAFNLIFENGWAGPQFNTDGSISHDDLAEHGVYIEALRKAASAV